MIRKFFVKRGPFKFQIFVNEAKKTVVGKMVRCPTSCFFEQSTVQTVCIGEDVFDINRGVYNVVHRLLELSKSRTVTMLMEQLSQVRNTFNAIDFGKNAPGNNMVELQPAIPQEDVEEMLTLQSTEKGQ